MTTPTYPTPTSVPSPTPPLPDDARLLLHLAIDWIARGMYFGTVDRRLDYLARMRAWWEPLLASDLRESDAVTLVIGEGDHIPELYPPQPLVPRTAKLQFHTRTLHVREGDRGAHWKEIVQFAAFPRVRSERPA